MACVFEIGTTGFRIRLQLALLAAFLDCVTKWNMPPTTSSARKIDAEGLI
jgi:hypothetical protein